MPPSPRATRLAKLPLRVLLPRCSSTPRSLSWQTVFALGLLFLGPSAAAQSGVEPSVMDWNRFIQPLVESEVAGTAYFPAEFTGGQPTKVLDPRGFTVHMTRAADPGEEEHYPAGEPFVPPSGRWRVWLQGKWAMTPYSDLVVFPSSGRDGRVRPRMLPVHPAGRVLAPAGDLDVAGSDLWLLFAGGDEQRYELSRRRALADVGDGLLMPAGQTLAGAWNRKEERFTAFSLPFRVKPGVSTHAPLERPDDSRSWLVVYLERPGELSSRTLADIELFGVQGESPVAADETVLTDWGLYAVWYDLRPQSTYLTGGGRTLYFEPEQLELEPGGIHWLEGALLPRPTLTVNLVLPDLVRQGPFALEIRKLPEETTIAVQELDPRAGGHRFTDLTSGLLEVRLLTTLGTFVRRVEVAPGEERSIAMEPELIEVYGTVRHGDTPAPATVVFQTIAGELVRAETDDEGAYRLFALQPLRWVDVQIRGVSHHPWRDFFSPSLDTSQELDFDIPDSGISIRIVDARTRKGIPEAKLAVRNRFLVPVPTEDGEDSPERTDRVLVHQYTANADGLVEIAPPRSGQAEFLASADGYEPMRDPVALEIEDPSEWRELELVLEPYESLAEVQVLLPTGAPAQDAEILRVSALPDGELLFSGRTDDQGVVAIPALPARGLVLVKHPSTASLVFDWSPPPMAGQRSTWTLPRRSSFPLSIKVLDPSGQVPARGAEMQVWLDGRRVSGRYLRWLLDTGSRADYNGYWTTHRLPDQPVRVLAWSGDASIPPPAEGRAEELPYPWPSEIVLHAIP